MSEERSAAAVWRDGVMQSLVAFDPSQPRDDQGQWTSDGSDQSASQQDAEAKALYAQLLGLPPDQRDKFLAGLNNDQLTRLGRFASTGKATDGPIADIRNKTGQAMASRGLNPGTAGLKSKGGAKKKAAGKKGGSGKSGGGSKGGGSKGGGKSGGSKGSGKSSGGSKSSGSKKSSSSGSKSSGSKSSGSKTTTPKAPKPPPPPPAPELRQIGPGRRGPGGPGGSGPGVPTPGPPKTQARRKRRSVRASGAPDGLGSLAEWNAARHAARREQERGSGG